MQFNKYNPVINEQGKTNDNIFARGEINKIWLEEDNNACLWIFRQINIYGVQFNYLLADWSVELCLNVI